jgi:hypothetical protein
VTHAADVTGVLLEPAGGAFDDRLRDRLRERLASGIVPIVERLPAGEPIVVTLPLLRRARDLPDAPLLPEEAFVWKPAFVRRSLGLAVVDTCVEGRFPTPMEAIGPVSDAAVAEWERTGWRTFHWEPWLSRLAVGARASVLAEALGWATALWSAVEWNRLPRRPQVGGPADQWMCPAGRVVILKARAELRVPLPGGPPGSAGVAAVGGSTALVSVSRGCPGATWAEELAYLALVAGLRSPTRPVPDRVLGLWPDAGTHAAVDMDDAVLTAAVERVIATVDTVVDARQPAIVRG